MRITFLKKEIRKNEAELRQNTKGREKLSEIDHVFETRVSQELLLEEESGMGNEAVCSHAS